MGVVVGWESVIGAMGWLVGSGGVTVCDGGGGDEGEGEGEGEVEVEVVGGEVAEDRIRAERWLFRSAVVCLRCLR